MAGTLLPAPTLGASDWSAWITLVDAVRRGYLAASYTNFAASAESALAAGSLVEVAGAIYSFTATAIDYTGAGSTNSDLYIYVKPDAVVSTATVVAWGSAPVWVDAKQGFYASAASTTRAIGGMYVGNAGSYCSKYFYDQSTIVELLNENKTRPILHRTIEMGEWDMDTTASINIPHGINKPRKIRNVTAIVYEDPDEDNWIQSPYVSAAGTAAGLSMVRSTVKVLLTRVTGGVFDSTSYNGTASTVANCGYIYIEYEA